jgi:4,5-dihydroxyphthalate decarboxylase
LHKLALTAAFCDSDHMRDLAMGRVVPEGIDLTCLNAPVEEIFYRFLMNQEFDVSELSFAKYVSLRAKGDDRFIALPIFPSRMFRHSSLYVRADCPLKEISELKGRKVGIPEWAQTAAVYSRGFLVHQYGLELKDINWVQSGVNQAGRTEKVQIQLPEGINLTRVTDRSLNDMLLSGDIDAALAARPPIAFSDGQGKVKRFFDNSREVEAAYYRETGIFPIMHVIAVRKEILDAHPWVARNLFTAFDEARRCSIERVLDLTASQVPIPWGNDYAREGQALMGKDFFSYGIEPNRKTLDAFLAYAFEQGVCEKRLTAEENFPKQLQSEYKV